MLPSTYTVLPRLKLSFILKSQRADFILDRKLKSFKCNHKLFERDKFRNLLPTNEIIWPVIVFFKHAVKSRSKHSKKIKIRQFDRFYHGTHYFYYCYFNLTICLSISPTCACSSKTRLFSIEFFLIFFRNRISLSHCKTKNGKQTKGIWTVARIGWQSCCQVLVWRWARYSFLN